MYKDCHQVNIRDNMKDGIYKLNLDGTSIWTFCRNGSTLIQQRNPFSGNSKSYFQRTFKEYVDGFGFVENEFFLGLKNIIQLYIKQNVVLQVEGLRQDDGTEIVAEFHTLFVLGMMLDDMR